MSGRGAFVAFCVLLGVMATLFARWSLEGSPALLLVAVLMFGAIAGIGAWLASLPRSTERRRSVAHLSRRW